jgi:hypothetical protein
MGSACIDYDFEDDWLLGGEVEFDEIEDDALAPEVELQRLTGRAQAARDAGA